MKLGARLHAETFQSKKDSDEYKGENAGKLRIVQTIRDSSAPTLNSPI